MVSAAVVSVAVVADPAERRARGVLAWFGPAREAVDVVPVAARARHDVDGEADRMLAALSVSDKRITGRDRDAVVGSDERDVGQ